MMTLGHFIYIPGVLLVGAVIGYVLGSRSAAVAREDDAERDRAKAARAAARATREAAQRED